MNSETPEESELAPPPPKPPGPSKFGGYAMFVAAGILLSRVAGLIRTSVFAHYLGASAAADAFNVALKVPNFLQNLLGEGVLSASFIPVYSRLVSRGEQKEADRVAGVFVSYLALIVIAIVAVGVLATPLILGITAAGLDPPVMAMAIKYTRIIFPGVGLLVLYAWALGILNTHRQFFIGYVAPVLWSAAMIATLVIFGMTMSGARLAHALAWGTLVGCVLQFAIEIPFVLRHAKHLSFGFDRTLEPVKTIFRNIVPVVGGRGVVQISGYVDTFIASFLPTGAVTSLFYAQTIYMLPISVFGMSVAAAELPQMAGEKGSEEEISRALRRRLDRGIRQVAFFVVPTTVAFILIGRVLIAALYQRGKFSADTTLLVWYILIGSSIGLLVATFGRLYSSAFYALHDTKTPFRIALARVFGGAGLALLFAFPLRPMFAAGADALGLPIPHTAGGAAALGVVGITAASGIATWIEFLLLRRGIRRRLGAGEAQGGYLAKLWFSAVLAGLASLAADIYFARDLAARLPLSRIAEALLACGIFGVVYFAVAFALRVPEVTATLSRLTRR
ncbi:MAG TPA: murein biosynthesis integral membrane protein MurJ [Thermoanaerobaculia bacterium]|nr:murein biosynthesis integral membrane protein MurJ [Thermoanaerobaculia bacterium]